MNVFPHIAGHALLSPLDRPGRGTWDAIGAGETVTDRGFVDERLTPGDPQLDKSIRLAVAVGRAAAARARWSPEQLRDTPLFLGTSKGPVLAWMTALDTLRRGETLPELLARQLALGPGSLATLTGELLGMHNFRHTSIAACSSGIHALHRAAGALRRGEFPRALVIAADASVHPLFEAGFHNLGVLAPVEADGHRRCRPFDPAGTGFLLSEAAAAVALELAPAMPETPKNTPATPTSSPIFVESTRIGGDGTHLLATDSRGHTLRQVLAAARDESPLAFVHAHGTGTGHDAHERDAIHAACGSAVPIFSHKRWLGHSLGAAGLLGVVLSAMCHEHGRTLTGEAVPAGGRSLTVAQGFGGHIGVVGLRG